MRKKSEGWGNINIDAGGVVSEGSTKSASSSEAKAWCILVVTLI